MKLEIYNEQIKDREAKINKKETMKQITEMII